jgi:hypothetical protein
MTDIIRLLQSVSDSNTTIAELNEHQTRIRNQSEGEAQSQEDDESRLALALHMSLEEY